jgi:hypothetical protein
VVGLFPFIGHPIPLDDVLTMEPIPEWSKTMPKRTTVANGSDPAQQKASADANAVQDAVNLVAVVGCFHRHLLTLHRSGVCGDDLINLRSRSPS